jgi:predicted small metal-binding protein
MPEEANVMRAVDCPCGEHFEGSNDEELMRRTREHADKEHPDEYQDADLRLLINRGAYDTGR